MLVGQRSEQAEVLSTHFRCQCSEKTILCSLQCSYHTDVCCRAPDTKLQVSAVRPGEFHLAPVISLLVSTYQGKEQMQYDRDTQRAENDLGVLQQCRVGWQDGWTPSMFFVLVMPKIRQAAEACTLD